MMRLIGIVLAVAAALALAGCGSEERTGATRAQEMSYEPTQAGDPSGAPVATAQGITVVGTGTAKVAPDTAEWSFGVRSEAGTAREAMAANAQAARRLVAALRSAGIAKDDLRTDHVSLWPQSDETGRSVVGYTASNTVHVTVRIARAGAIVDAAVEAGANEVSGPGLIASETDEQYSQALDEAFADARRRAEAIAGNAGVTLGRPVAIVEGGGAAGPMPYGRALVDEAASVPVEGGNQEIQATLSVTFAIS